MPLSAVSDHTHADSRTRHPVRANTLMGPHAIGIPLKRKKPAQIAPTF